MRAVLLTSIAQ